MELQGKTALVTGAGVRIGRAIAVALARAGVDVGVHYRTSDTEAREVVSEIEALGRRAFALQADLGHLEQVRALIHDSVEALGKLDILINSASIFERGTIYDTTEANWDRHMAINLKAPFFLCQGYAQRLREEQRGHIINIADWRAVRPGTQYMAYTFSKSGLVYMTKSLAQALGPNVQVNAIAPGPILPPPGEGYDYFEQLAERLPLKRTGSPEDIVQAVLYLLRSDFVTGHMLYVTGGEEL